MKFRSMIPAGWALACGLLAAAGPAAAYTYLEASYGTPQAGLSAKAMAMGGAMTAVTDGAFSLVSNPAMLGWETGSSADATLRVARVDETRFDPIWDSFQQYIIDTAVSENASTYLGLNGGAVWKACKHAGGLTLAGGYFERYNLEYNFVDERREAAKPDRVKATQFITMDRAVYSMSFGGSYRMGGVAAGLTLHRYFGDLSYMNQTVPGLAATSADAASSTTLKRDLSGLGASFGVAADVDPRVRVAASFEVPVTLGVDWIKRITLTATDSSWAGHSTIRYPGRLSMGMSYRPRNTLQTTFSASAVRTFWKDVPSHDGTLTAFGASSILSPLAVYRDTWEMQFGLEHVFYNNLPTRFGLFYRQAYAADDVDVAGLTAGTGYKSGPFDMGIGMEVSKRNSRQAAITPRSGADAKTDKVQDSMLRGVIDVRYHF